MARVRRDGQRVVVEITAQGQLQIPVAPTSVSVEVWDWPGGDGHGPSVLTLKSYGEDEVRPYSPEAKPGGWWVRAGEMRDARPDGTRHWVQVTLSSSLDLAREALSDFEAASATEYVRYENELVEYENKCVAKDEEIATLRAELAARAAG